MSPLVTGCSFAILLPALFFAQPAGAYGFLEPQIRNYGSFKKSGAKKLRSLSGHVPPDVAQSTQIGPVDENTVLSLFVVFPLNDEQGLNQFILEVTNPRSSNFQKFISQDEFAKRYSPTEEQVAQVIEHLSAQGFRVISTEPNRLFIRAEASVKVINQVFNTEINHYVDQKGDEYFAPAYELQVDSALHIQSVIGLENRIRARHHAKRLQSLRTTLNSTPSLTPTLIKKAYSLSTTFTGSGQTLALFELDGFASSDITTYENHFGLPHVPLQVVLLDGANGAPGSGADEVTLDIELMIAMAPQASKIIVYEGPNSSKGLIDTYNRITTDNLASAISTSWGLSELSATSSILQAENSIFKQMVAQGQVLYAASGDSGAYDNGITLSVDDPASQPMVVAVGGTTLNTDSFGNYLNEKTWSYQNGPGEGGGGGISAVWTIPSWQQGVMDGTNMASGTMRNVPDIALDADPNTGYAIFSQGQWYVYGGTSCAAPLWAAFTALVNQSRASNAKGPIGFTNPLIYESGKGASYQSIFHDITVGTNGHYPATTGYDLASGWGSFKGDALLALLAQNSTTPPSCTHANPTVQISPTSQRGIRGATLTYTVSVTNNDSAGCGSSAFNLTASVPRGFSNTFTNTNPSIEPSQTSISSLSVRSSPSSTIGSHTFSVLGTNTQSSLSGTASGSYIVRAR